MKKFLRNLFLITLIFVLGFSNLDKINADEPIVVQTVEDPTFVQTEDVNNLDGLQPGEIDAEKDATIVENPDGTPTTSGDSREAEVTVEIDGEAFVENTQLTTYEYTDVSLVIDASGSMTSSTVTMTVDGVNTTMTRLAAAKLAAINLVTDLLNSNTTDKTYFRVSLTIFSGNGTVVKMLSSNLTELTNAINGINSSSSTNVQDGINKGATTLYNQPNGKVMILLSDGETNELTDNVNGNTKGYVDTTNGIEYYWTGNNNPSGAAQAAADFFKASNDYRITFYTVGLGTSTTANNLLKYIAGQDTDENGNPLGTYSRFLTAANGDDLIDAFDAIIENISTTRYDVATEVVLTDIIPNDFNLKDGEEARLKSTYGTSNVTVETVAEGTKITYNIGTVNVLNSIPKFIYNIIAKDEYHGSMYTNFSAVLSGKPATGNNFAYTLDGNGKFNITLEKPAVVIPAIAEDDNAGTVKSTETKTITIASIVANDNNSNYTAGTQIENAAALEDTIEIVSGTTNGTLVLNSARTAFIYTPTVIGATSDSFTYRIYTTVIVGYDINDNPIYETVKSNVATVSLTIQKVMGTVVTKYVEKDNHSNVIGADVTTTGQAGTSYTTSSKIISNWTFTGVTPSNASGKYIDGTITVYYEYTKTLGTVVAHYVDEEGNSISGDVTTTGQINVDTYTTTQKTIANWTFKEMEGGSASTSGTYTSGTLNVTYVYKKTMGTLDVRHVWMDGSNEVLILAEGQKTEQQGTSYTTSPLNSTTYYMWNLVTTPANASGTYTNGNTIVTYVYEKVIGNVVVKYVEKDNHSNVLSTDTNISGQLGTSYTTSSKTISNWTFTGVTPSNATGTYTDGTITVYYEYIKTLGKVIAHYVDTEGNALLSNVETTGQVNVDNYSTEQKIISNWTFLEMASTSGATSGKYTESDINVIYVYTKTLGTVVAHYVDEEGNSISGDVTTTGQINVDSYTTTQKTIANWTFKEMGAGSASVSGTYTSGTLNVTYVYEKTMGTLDVRHVWMDGSNEVLILAEVQKTEQQGTSYTTNSLNSTTYYMWSLVTTPANASGTYTNGNTIVTYVYEKVMGTVVAKYVEKDNHSNVISIDAVTTGQLGTGYTTSPKSISNWTFIGTNPGNASGVYTSGTITVYYEYTKTMGTLIVHYLEFGTNVSVSPNDYTEGQINVDTYTTSPKTIPNWTYVGVRSTSDPVNGTYSDGDTDVIYEYTKTLGIVVAHYVDEEGNSISGDVTTTGQINVDTYTTTQKTIANWTFKEMEDGSASTSGTYTSGTLDVTYVYEKTMGTLNVRHVWMDGSNEVLILAEGQKTQQQGTSYTTSPLDETTYNMWELITTPANASGTYTNGNTIVTYVYEKVIGNVVVKYVEKDNHSNVLSTDTNISGQLGTSYTTSSKTISNWTFIGTNPGNASGVYTSGTITVYYEYTKTLGKVIAHYVDTEGNSISGDVTTTGQINVDTYSTTQKTIANWTFKEMEDGSASTSGTYTSGTLDVTYVYEKTMGTVKVYYVDTLGNSIVSYDTMSGQVNVDTYTTSPKTIANWTYVEVHSASAPTSGTYSEDMLEVIYVYTKTMGTLDVRHVWMDGENEVLILAEEQKEEQTGTEYSTDPLDGDTYPMWRLVETPRNAEGTYNEQGTVVTYVYEKVMGKVIVKYLDENGKELLAPEEFESQIGTPYSTTSKEIDGYILLEVDGSESGSYASEDITVIYVYEVAGEGGDDIIDTGINNSNIIYGIFIIGLISLVSSLIIKKRFNN